MKTVLCTTIFGLALWGGLLLAKPAPNNMCKLVITESPVAHPDLAIDTTDNTGDCPCVAEATFRYSGTEDWELWSTDFLTSTLEDSGSGADSITTPFNNGPNPGWEMDCGDVIRFDLKVNGSSIGYIQFHCHPNLTCE